MVYRLALQRCSGVSPSCCTEHSQLNSRLHILRSYWLTHHQLLILRLRPLGVRSPLLADEAQHSNLRLEAQFPLESAVVPPHNGAFAGIYRQLDLLPHLSLLARRFDGENLVPCSYVCGYRLSAPASLGLPVACQLDALCPVVLVIATTDDINGTHGDFGAGLKPPPAAKLLTLPFRFDPLPVTVTAASPTLPEVTAASAVTDTVLLSLATAVAAASHAVGGCLPSRLKVMTVTNDVMSSPQH